MATIPSTSLENGASSAFSPAPDAIARVPRALAFRYDALPLHLENGSLVVALPDITDAPAVEALRTASRMRVRPVRMERNAIRERLNGAYGSDAAVALGDRRGSDGPVVRTVDAVLRRAIESHASDVHVEPLASGGRVRVRVDGILREHESIGADLFVPFVSRLKLLAGMDIADKRQPQDGRYTIPHEHREIDARVSSIPTIDGEKIVIRLLDHHAQAPVLSRLGMSPDFLTAYRRFVHAPWGFVVVTGPTGSGKTTTLYASLAEIDSVTKSICSVEDPIEMRLRGIAQVQVNPRAGVTFPLALRSFMRQDPNVIMVGEMRDAETAAVGISASLAGQLVFTTLHSNDAPRTVERLIELGVAPHSLAAGLTAVVAQRLLRRLCDCKRLEPIPAHLAHALSLAQDTWYVAGACTLCDGTGYVGRLGVYELLAVDDEIRETIANGGSSVVVAHAAKQRGYRPMFFDGLDKVLAGETGFAELSRVVSLDAVR